MTKTEEKLDKIIKLLEEIRANQEVVYYPPVYYPPQPQLYPDWTEPLDWTCPSTAGDIGGNLYH